MHKGVGMKSHENIKIGAIYKATSKHFIDKYVVVLKMVKIEGHWYCRYSSIERDYPDIVCGADFFEMNYVKYS